MNFRLSTYQLCILRTLARDKMLLQDVRKLDKRPLYGLFKRGFFNFDARLNAHITNEGWEVVKASQARPHTCKVPADPKFVETARTDKLKRRAG